MIIFQYNKYDESYHYGSGVVSVLFLRNKFDFRPRHPEPICKTDDSNIRFDAIVFKVCH